MVDLDISIIFAGLSIAASIVYYASVLRNADQTRRTQLYMDVKRQLDDPDFWLRFNNLMMVYEWKDNEEFQEKYGPLNSSWKHMI